MGPHILVLGGQRSGKSRTAEAIVAASGRRPVYIATATPGDEEMAERIAAHRTRRGAEWQTVEEPLDLCGALDAHGTAENAVLVDCLTLWLSNLFAAKRPIEAETDRLVSLLPDLPGLVVLVSNEVGSGIIPMNALARRYADAHGVLNQRVAAAADRVILMAAGIPVTIKPAQFAESLA